MSFPLEVWLSGTHHELNAAVAALDDLGRLGWTSDRIPLSGGERGRVRLYLQLHVAPASGPAPSAGRAGARGGLLAVGGAR